MTKKNEQTKTSNVKDSTEAKEQVKAEKRTLCYLASKADHIIEVQNNGQTSYIQPFGRIKIVKEQIKIDQNDAKYLTFIKL